MFRFFPERTAAELPGEMTLAKRIKRQRGQPKEMTKPPLEATFEASFAFSAVDTI
jgi:hypothetical protein